MQSVLAEPGAPEAVPRPASTVVLARDGAVGLEVLLLERSSAAFFASAAVFPGGVVEGADGAIELATCCGGLDDAHASARLGVAAGGLAWYVAAIRETFEEAGVLLARDADGRLVAFGASDVEGFARFRRELNAGTSTFAQLCTDTRLTLAVADLGYISHWLTPRGTAKRFDTRFFVAAMPAGQEPLHDHSETVAQRFVRPADALAMGEAGRMSLVPPTRVTLEFVSRFATVEALLDAASKLRDIPLIEPVIVPGSDPVSTLMPGDEGYEALWRASRA